MRLKKDNLQSNLIRQLLFTDTIIENSRYKIVFTKQGVITSLIDKRDNNRECITPVNKLYANDLGSGRGNSGSPLRVENAGPVSVTLVAESYRPLKHTSKDYSLREQRPY